MNGPASGTGEVSLTSISFLPCGEVILNFHILGTKTRETLESAENLESLDTLQLPRGYQAHLESWMSALQTWLDEPLPWKGNPPPPEDQAVTLFPTDPESFPKFGELDPEGLEGEEGTLPFWSPEFRHGLNHEQFRSRVRNALQGLAAAA